MDVLFVVIILLLPLNVINASVAFAHELSGFAAAEGRLFFNDAQIRGHNTY